MGMLIAEALGIAPAITPCRQSDVTLAAPRPADVSFDSGKARSLIGFRPSPMREEIVRLECIRGSP
jgi:dTDP-4-dehydrorhamnose reductase